MVVLSLGNLISLKNLSLHDSGVGVPSAFCARNKDSSLALYQVVMLNTVLKVDRKSPFLLLFSSLGSVCFFGGGRVRLGGISIAH